jgi:hypothetical protein
MIETTIGILIGFIIGFLTSYFVQKGKNRAMKEDIKKITFEKESVSSAFTLDIEKRKFQYDTKKEQYLKYFNLLDEMNSNANISGFNSVMPLINSFISDFIKAAGNKKKETEIVGSFSESINSEIQKSNENWIKLKNETNSIRLVANDETIDLLNKLESLYTVIFERSGQIFKAIPEMVVQKETDQLKNYTTEIQLLGNQINFTKDQLINAMRNDLKEI